MRSASLRAAANRPTLAALFILVALGGCSTVGVDRRNVRPPTTHPFDQALINYATGDLDEAQVGALAAIETNPLDARATDLLRAVLKEKGLIEEIKRSEAVELPEFAPQTPTELVRVIRGRSPAVREAVFGVIEARAALREANVDVGPELNLLTRFYPLGILARMTQSLYGGWWERKAKMHAAEAEIVEALANYGRALELVNKEALLAYLDAAAAQERLMSIDRERGMLDDQFEQTSILVSNGLTLPRTPLVTRNEIGSLMHDRSLAEQQLATAKAQLNALMNRSPTAPIVVTAQGLAWKPAASLNGALTQAYINRFELDEAEAQIKTAEAQKALAETQNPKVDLYTSYGESDEKTETRFMKGFTVGAITRIPLAIVPLKKAQGDQHDAIIRQLELREQQVRNEIAVEVVDAYHGWEAALSELNSERSALAVAREDRRVAVAERTVEVDEDPLSLSRANVEYVRAQRAVFERGFGVQRSLVELGASVGEDATKMNFVTTQSTAQWSSSVFNGIEGSERRALWVWRKPFLKNLAEMQFFIDLLSARQIGTVFLFVRADELVEQSDALRQFLRLTGENGIAVQALNGEHEWLKPARSAEALGYVEDVKTFNRGSPVGARFAAVHLDVEPQALTEWDDDSRKEALLFAYIELLDTLKVVRDELPVIVDVPIWFADREVDGILLSDVVMRRTDGVAFMAYGTSDTRREALIERIARSSETSPGQFWIGVSADARHLCAGTRAEQFEADIRSIESGIGSREQFAGVAIHELDRYRDLLLGLSSSAGSSQRKCLQASQNTGTSG